MIHYPDKSVAKNLRNVLKIGSQRGGRLGLLFVLGVFFVCVGLVNCSTCCCSPYFPERAAVESLTLLYFVTVPCFFEPPGRKDNPRNAASAPNRFDV